MLAALRRPRLDPALLPRRPPLTVRGSEEAIVVTALQINSIWLESVGGGSTGVVGGRPAVGR